MELFSKKKNEKEIKNLHSIFLLFTEIIYFPISKPKDKSYFS